MLKFATVQHSALCNIVAKRWAVDSHLPRPFVGFAPRLVSKAFGESGSNAAILTANRVVVISRERREIRCQISLHENRFGRRGFSGLCHCASPGC